jgi:DNA (cytosine-5)-methyltransferase 1
MIQPHELIIDCFAGGGGASLGIEMALGRSPDVAINHDPEAIAMHMANHPATKHYQTNIWKVDPADVLAEFGGRPVGLLWASPDCKHFSKAKGGKPRAKNIRDLAWTVLLWAQRARPRIICLENVEEFQTWGPLDDQGMPDPARAGETFKRWFAGFKRLGYRGEIKEVRGCDFGAPTIRKRLIIILRRDGLPIIWPDATHAKDGANGLQPWRTAADIIDWSLAAPSIFLTREEGRAIGCNRPLAEATLSRIAKGVKRYVLDAGRPFIVPITHTGGDRTHSIDEPVRTITTAHRGELALIQPFISRQFSQSIGHSIDDPMGTVTAGGGGKSALVTAFLAQHNLGAVGRAATEPLSTVTARGTQQTIIAAHMINLRGSDRRMSPADAPLPSITSQGTHIAAVQAFLIKYYGTDQDPRLDEPLHTVTTKPRFGLVHLNGDQYQIVDIGMRMLTARELFRAQSFPDSYQIDVPGPDGKMLTKTAQIRLCGNSVCPLMAMAIVRANVLIAEREAA